MCVCMYVYVRGRDVGLGSNMGRKVDDLVAEGIVGQLNFAV